MHKKTIIAIHQEDNLIVSVMISVHVTESYYSCQHTSIVDLIIFIELQQKFPWEASEILNKKSAASTKNLIYWSDKATVKHLKHVNY